jgi:hypothetical protein
MADTPSVKITKSLLWRGLTKTFTNRYHFTAGVPASSAAWDTFFDAIVAAEKLIYGSQVTIVKADGYAADSDIPVRTKTYTTAGTGTPGGALQERQVAALARWTTDAVTVRNHPIYLFSYYHAANMSTVGGHQDEVDATQKGAITTYATAWVTGFSDGTTTHKRAGPRGAVALTGACELYLTHRDFPRR